MSQTHQMVSSNTFFAISSAKRTCVRRDFLDAISRGYRNGDKRTVSYKGVRWSGGTLTNREFLAPVSCLLLARVNVLLRDQRDPTLTSFLTRHDYMICGIRVHVGMVGRRSQVGEFGCTPKVGGSFGTTRGMVGCR